MTGCSNTKEQSNLYKQYINKTWISSDRQMDENVEKEFSFIIKKIEDGYVEGQYSFTPWVIILQKEANWYFTGYIENSQIKCQLWNENTEVGSMVLEYVSDACLKVDIDYNDEIADEELYSESIYKVYNIEDLKETDIVLDYNRAVTVELNKQGKVQMLPGIMLIRKAYPVVFMTNEQGDILYEFTANFFNGCRIEEFDIRDLNGDDLEEIEIITYLGDTGSFHWLYYQNEDGSFSEKLSWMKE